MTTPILEKPQQIDGDPAADLFHQFHEAAADKIVVSREAPAGLAEQYRKLAATLYYGQAERSMKVVMVVSAIPGEGKTLTSTNLALTLSESYKRNVLLIDLDLRRPSLQTVFQVPNLFGMADYLSAETTPVLTPLRISEHLSLIPAGTPTQDPIAGLTSDRLRNFLREVSEMFDWVIIDTPPVALLPDAKLLGSMADAAVLVIGAGSTPYPLIQRAIVALGRNRIFGVVLNRVDARRAAGGYSYDSYYTYYGTRAGRKR